LVVDRFKNSRSLLKLAEFKWKKARFRERIRKCVVGVDGLERAPSLGNLSFFSSLISLTSLPLLSQISFQDPEGILAAPVGGHIARRELAKAVQTNAELAERVEADRQKAREELVEKRASRNAPLAAGQEAELVTYFLDTEADEMEFEIARCRPALTEAFFKHVDSAVGELRFAKSPDEGKLAELEVLRDYLRAGVEAFDANVEAMKQPAARMRKLLTAPDKKATLLQMAGDGEVDQALINLLQQNIDAARSAGQEEPVKFLEKVRDAARKFVIR